MQTVVIGFLGATLDRGIGAKRWNKWRPTVSLCEQPDLVVDRYEMIYQPGFQALAQTVADDVRQVSPETEVRLHAVPLADPWDLEEVFGALHDFAGGYPFDVERERYLINVTTGTHVGQISLFLLAESRHMPGELVQVHPPHVRSSGQAQVRVIDLDLSRYDRLAARFSGEQAAAETVLKSGIETRNEHFNALISRIETVAVASADPILLTGPTGAGKTQLARRIYDLRRARRQVSGRFVEVNCATLRGDQAMSALFGHVKGAFTGASGVRQGLLRSADGGVLFLDEIAELGSDEQAMLLHAVEEGRFLPMGADREVESNFQLIAGSNADLPSLVRAGRFRSDLLARIDLWTFALPGLSARHEDLEPNLDYELARWTGRTGKRLTISREARAAFVRFGTAAEGLWAANFRDLNAAVTRMATLASGGRIRREEVDEEIERLRSAWREPRTSAQSRLERVLGLARAESLDRFERVQLSDVLEVCERAASLSDAGRTLFAQSRKRRTSVNDADRLRKYLARFDLTWHAVRGGE